MVGSRERRRLWFALAKSAKMHPLHRRMISWQGFGLGLAFGLATQDAPLLISAVALKAEA